MRGVSLDRLGQPFLVIDCSLCNLLGIEPTHRKPHLPSVLDLRASWILL